MPLASHPRFPVSGRGGCLVDHLSKDRNRDRCCEEAKVSAVAQATEKEHGKHLKFALKAFVLSEHKSTQRLRWVQPLGLAGAAPAVVVMLSVSKISLLLSLWYLPLFLLQTPTGAEQSVEHGTPCRKPGNAGRSRNTQCAVSSSTPALRASNCRRAVVGIMLAQIHTLKVAVSLKRESSVSCASGADRWYGCLTLTGGCATRSGLSMSMGARVESEMPKSSLAATSLHDRNLGLREFVKRCYEKRIECNGNIPVPESLLALLVGQASNAQLSNYQASTFAPLQRCNGLKLESSSAVEAPVRAV